MLGTLAANAVPALCSAGLWGMADFCGGMGSRSAGGTIHAALRVILLCHLLSFVVLFAIVLARGEMPAPDRLLLWGIASGVAGGLALTCFYVALSRGAMGASAAISGLLAAALPALVSVLVDGTPGWRRAGGFVVAAVAIWLIAAGERTKEDRTTVLLAVAAGVGFGLYFIALRFAGTGGVFTTMAESRVGSLSICTLALLLVGSRGGTAHIARRTLAWIGSTALLDTSGNLLFVQATRAGRLDVAAVLGSLYPASTILLAAGVLRERPTRRQGLGMAVALGAVVLIAG